MIALLWARVWKWVCAIGAVLAGLGGIWLAGRGSGKHAEQAHTQAAENKAATAQATAHEQEVRHDVEVETAKLPDAPPQSVGTADPATAAGKLRDDGWTRD